MTGAQFEIRIDGTPRSYRDRKDYAIEAARLIKSRKSAQHDRGQRLAKRQCDCGGSQVGVRNGPQAPLVQPRLRDRPGPRGPTPCSAASGILAASTKFEAAQVFAVVLGVALPEQAGEPSHR